LGYAVFPKVLFCPIDASKEKGEMAMGGGLPGLRCVSFCVCFHVALPISLLIGVFIEAPLHGKPQARRVAPAVAKALRPQPRLFPPVRRLSRAESLMVAAKKANQRGEISHVDVPPSREQLLAMAHGNPGPQVIQQLEACLARKPYDAEVRACLLLLAIQEGNTREIRRHRSILEPERAVPQGFPFLKLILLVGLLGVTGWQAHLLYLDMKREKQKSHG